MKNVVKILSMVLVFVFLFVGCGVKFDDSKSISVVAREDGSGTKSAFMEIIGLKGKADVSGIIIATGTAAALAEVQSNSRAVAYESLGYVTDKVKKLNVEGVEATIANIKNGSYKIARPLNVLYKQERVESGVSKVFFDFLQSKEAQTIISAEGYVATNDAATNFVKPNSEIAGKITVSGSTSLQPLMIVLGAEFEKMFKGVSVEIGGGGSGTGYTNAENGTSDFGMISENFNATKAPTSKYYEVAKDGIAVIVNTANPNNNITMAQLKNIYNAEQSTDKISTWADLK